MKPDINSPNEYIFNDRVLESLDLTLPKELANKARLLNPRKSCFETYRNLCIGLTLAAVAALAAILLLYTVDVATRNRKLRKQSEIMREQEKRLIENEEKYRIIFEHSEEPMLLIYRSEFIVVFANQLLNLNFSTKRMTPCSMNKENE